MLLQHLCVIMLSLITAKIKHHQFSMTLFDKFKKDAKD